MSPPVIEPGIFLLLGKLINRNTLSDTNHQKLVVLTGGAAASGLSLVYDKPKSQSQDGPHHDHDHRNPQSRTQHHHRGGLDSGVYGFELVPDSQGRLCEGGGQPHADYLNS